MMARPFRQRTRRGPWRQACKRAWLRRILLALVVVGAGALRADAGLCAGAADLRPDDRARRDAAGRRPALDPARRHRAGAADRRPVLGGRALLPASWRGFRRHRAGVQARRRWRPQSRRLHHRDADRQEPLSLAVADADAKAAGNPARAVDRPRLVEAAGRSRSISTSPNGATGCLAPRRRPRTISTSRPRR